MEEILFFFWKNIYVMINKVLIGNVHSLDDNEQHKNLLSKEDFIVPKNKFQDAIFTIIMAIIMVYGWLYILLH